MNMGFFVIQTSIACLNFWQSFEEAILAMDLVKPILLLTDKSCSNWPIEVQSYRIASLRWHVSLDSPSSDFTNTCNCKNFIWYFKITFNP